MRDHGTTSNWKKALLNRGAIIKDAIQNLDESALQIALVVSDEYKLIGTITDGDIRRGLLGGLNLGSPIDHVIYLDPMVAPSQMAPEAALQVMKANGVRQLPIVDEERIIVGLYLLKEFLRPAVRSNPMVIMVGGKGTRLQPHTENCPKPLLPVGGKPMLEHIIECAKAGGFKDFILAIHYLGHMIEDYFGNGERWGVNIRYLREESPLGTAGALSLMDSRPSESILVSNGDVLTDISYGNLVDFHIRHNAIGTMAVRPYEWQHPFGVVQTNGVDIIGFEEKPVYRTNVNAGVYVIDPSALDLLEAGKPCDMPGLLQRLQEAGKRIIVYPIHEPWLDVGRLSDFDQANKDFFK